MIQVYGARSLVVKAMRRGLGDPGSITKNFAFVKYNLE